MENECTQDEKSGEVLVIFTHLSYNAQVEISLYLNPYALYKSIGVTFQYAKYYSNHFKRTFHNQYMVLVLNNIFD